MPKTQMFGALLTVSGLLNLYTSLNSDGTTNDKNDKNDKNDWVVSQ